MAAWVDFRARRGMRISRTVARLEPAAAGSECSKKSEIAVSEGLAPPGNLVKGKRHSFGMGSPFAQGFTTGQWFPWVYQGRGRGGAGQPPRINFGGFEMKQERPELTTKLLPCPFCGSEPKLIRTFRDLFSICCQKEHCLQPTTHWSRDQESCAETWNLRYKPVEEK